LHTSLLVSSDRWYGLDSRILENKDPYLEKRSQIFFHTTKKCKRHLENMRHLDLYFLANFLGIFWVYVLQDAHKIAKELIFRFLT
jgi:hypothetical protein